jgi:ribose transport system substrate-binding protein
MRRLSLGLAVLVSLVVTGCSSSNAKYRIAVIPKGMTHEFWQSIERGARRAAADLKEQQNLPVDIVWEGPRKESDSAEQVGIIERQLAAGINGLVLAPQHSETMVPYVKHAVDKNVPVVIIDSGLNDQSIIVKYVATNNYNGGRLAAERLIKVLADEGKKEPKLILFRYDPGSESTEQREKGFEDYVNENKIKVTWLSNNKYLGATIDSAFAAARPLLALKKDEGIDGIFAPNESSATGVLNALRSLGLEKQVRLVAFDSSQPLLDALGKGEVDGLVIQDPYRMGYLGVWTLVQKLEGKDVGASTEQIGTGEYVITRDTHEPAKRIYKLGSPEEVRLHDPAAQAKRTSEELREKP